MTVQSMEVIDKLPDAPDVASDSDDNGEPVDGSDAAVSYRSSRINLSILVLSTVALLMGFLTFSIGQWVDAASDSPQLVDTADCQVIAMSVSGEPLDTSVCNELADLPIASVRGSGHSVEAHSLASTMRSSQVFVPAPGLWVHSILQSLG